MTIDFASTFKALTGHAEPFQWQERLFQNFCAGELPSALDLPTGLGKTSVMAVWLAALDLRAPKISLPRRLVYVVDRRAVVDQATAEAESLAKKIDAARSDPAVIALRERLLLNENDRALAISTLRGQFADNQIWREDPSRPAIVVGTVDMIGSRLLFQGYGVSGRMRPLHAAFLGIDTLVVLDEAHLVPPFEALLKTIARDRGNFFGPRSKEDRDIIPCFRLMSLSATGREDAEEQDDEDAGQTTGAERNAVFRLDEDDFSHPEITRRLNATKRLTIHDAFPGKASLTEALADRAWVLGAGPKPARVIVYCNSRADALSVKAEIAKWAKKDKIDTELLVGQRRVHECQALFDWLKEHGFIGGPHDRPPMPIFLVATSAGEVGVDLDADHMVCDLVEWERMVQRLGRVNRRGSKQAQVEVIALPPKKSGKDDESWEERLKRLRAPLDALKGDASPGAIVSLKENKTMADLLQKAQTPSPLRPALNRALVDAWSMTSLDNHAGRPDIQPWLRGWKKDDEPQTTVVWRRHLPVELQAGRSVRIPKKKSEVDEFFEAAPPHLSEMLEIETWRVADWLIARSKAAMKRSAKESGSEIALSKESPVLFVLNSKGELDRDDERRGVWTLGELAKLDNKEKKRDKDDFLKSLNNRTLVVSSLLGGLHDGMLADEEDGEPSTIDSDENWEGRPFRARETSSPAPTGESDWKQSYRLVIERSEDGEEIRWIVVDERRGQDETEESRAISRKEQPLQDHSAATERIARQFAREVGLPPAYTEMLAIVARLHDEGKKAPNWQHAFNAPRDGKIYAKTKGPINRKRLDGYRHEFGSLPYLTKDAEFKNLPDDLQELAVHLVAGHHGGARPLISARGCEDAPPSALEGRARDVALHFTRLQRRWGPWGLAWWVSLLRAADQKASGENEAKENSEGDTDTGEER